VRSIDDHDSTLSWSSIFIALSWGSVRAGLNSAGMARVVVDVMPKPEILDPQGKAVTGALARLGFAGISVRQGKRFELDVDGDLTEDRLAEVRRAAETLLANTVIETFNVRVEELPASPDEEDQGEATEQAELATQAG
jgi:phosphoribosylformylglycinamidine synthase subunit PurS